MKSLVTGASGYIGSALAVHLAARGDQLLLQYRRRKPAVQGTRVQLDWRHGSLDGSLFEGVETVYHCAGVAHQGAAPATYREVNQRATLQLAERALAAGVRRFIFLSSIKAAAAASAYGRDKQLTERALRELAGRGMAILVVRPALVYGPGVPGNLATLVRAVRHGLPMAPELGARSLVAREDLLALLGLMGRAVLADYSRFEVTDGERYSTRRLCLAIRAALHRSGDGWGAPTAAWRLGCALADVMRRGDEGLFDKLFGEECFCNRAVSREFNWQPTLQFEDVVVQMVAGA